MFRVGEVVATDHTGLFASAHVGCQCIQSIIGHTPTVEARRKLHPVIEFLFWHVRISLNEGARSVCSSNCLVQASAQKPNCTLSRPIIRTVQVLVIAILMSWVSAIQVVVKVHTGHSPTIGLAPPGGRREHLEFHPPSVLGLPLASAAASLSAVSTDYIGLHTPTSPLQEGSHVRGVCVAAEDGSGLRTDDNPSPFPDDDKSGPMTAIGWPNMGNGIDVGDTIKAGGRDVVLNSVGIEAQIQPTVQRSDWM
jgi:hypothetical protein